MSLKLYFQPHFAWAKSVILYFLKIKFTLRMTEDLLRVSWKHTQKERVGNWAEHDHWWAEEQHDQSCQLSLHVKPLLLWIHHLPSPDLHKMGMWSSQTALQWANMGTHTVSLPTQKDRKIFKGERTSEGAHPPFQMQSTLRKHMQYALPTSSSLLFCFCET